MKKQIIILFFLLKHLEGTCNMGTPINPGTHDATIITSKEFEILSEKIYITLDSKFEKAHYKVVYKIKADTIGLQIPFLFLALDQRNPLKILWDSKLVKIEYPKYEYNQFPDSIFLPYFSLFSEKLDNDLLGAMALKWEIERAHGFVTISETNYFKMDVTEGIHTVIIEYDGYAWEDKSDVIRDFSFRYSLSPARQWKYFHQLEVFIDASKYKKEIKANFLVKPKKIGENKFYWKFDKLPCEVIILSKVPDATEFKILVVKFGPLILLFISFPTLLVIHQFFNKKYRIENYQPRFSWVAIIFSIFLPLLPFVIYCNSLFWFDALLGEEASEEHGYYFLIFFMYPIAALLYFCLIQLSDVTFRDEQRKINNYIIKK